MPSDTKLAIEMGGTFTDYAIMQSGAIIGAVKALTTHSDPIAGSLSAAVSARQRIAQQMTSRAIWPKV